MERVYIKKLLKGYCTCKNCKPIDEFNEENMYLCRYTGLRLDIERLKEQINNK